MLDVEDLEGLGFFCRLMQVSVRHAASLERFIHFDSSVFGAGRRLACETSGPSAPSRMSGCEQVRALSKDLA